MTLITQFFPAATVLPQDVFMIFWPKSPLVVMLLIFSVAFPVLLSVTVLAEAVVPTLVPPNASEVGTSFTFGPFTMRLNVVV